MTRYVAFLRGINLGRRRPPMVELRKLFEQLGFANVATFIASGNVIFETKSVNAAKLEERIERQLGSKLGYAVDTFIRSEGEIAAVLQFKPFAEAVPAGGGTYVTFLKGRLEAATAKKLTACRTPVDAFCVNDREVYWLCRIRSSESDVWSSPAMRAVKLPTSTMRNTNSVRKLAAKHGLE